MTVSALLEGGKSAVFADSFISTAAEELSEEDQQLKNELDMLFERLTVRGLSTILVLKAATKHSNRSRTHLFTSLLWRP
jgi:hypothetical protein